MYLPAPTFCNRPVLAFLLHGCLICYLVPFGYHHLGEELGREIHLDVPVFDLCLFVAILDHRDDEVGHQSWMIQMINRWISGTRRPARLPAATSVTHHGTKTKTWEITSFSPQTVTIIIITVVLSSLQFVFFCFSHTVQVFLLPPWTSAFLLSLVFGNISF